MDPVDILTMAVDAARMIRSSVEPNAVLGEAARRMGCEPGDPAESLAVRITRLIEAAGERRGELHAFLREHRGTLYLNRHEAWTQDDVIPYEPEPEAHELVEYVNSEPAQERRQSLFGDHFPPFAVGMREAVQYVEFESEDMPETVRGLIDYPLDKPVLFTIETGTSPWFLWDILSAFADQYAQIYEHPQRFGVWGHDLSDLWIERLFYFPERRVIYPFVGS
jgi:hypothetical protein